MTREGMLANPPLSYFSAWIKSPQHVRPDFSVIITIAITHGALTCARPIPRAL